MSDDGFTPKGFDYTKAMEDIEATMRDRLGPWTVKTDDTTPTITIRKISQTIPVSNETALEYGLITEEQARANGWTPRPPLSRRFRFRMWRYRQWNKRPRIHFGPCDHSECDY